MKDRALRNEAAAKLAAVAHRTIGATHIGNALSADLPLRYACSQQRADVEPSIEGGNDERIGRKRLGAVVPRAELGAVEGVNRVEPGLDVRRI